MSSSVIQWHIAMHRGIIPIDARSGSGEHFCSLCGQIFRQHCSLIKHWRSSCNEIQVSEIHAFKFLDENPICAKLLKFSIFCFY